MKIYNFPELFNDYNRRLEFKELILSNVSWRRILNKIPKNLRTVDDEILKDYIIRIEITEKFENKPYTQPYIVREDTFTNTKEYLYLEEMGFRGPSDDEHIQYIFYVLPELKKILGKYIRKYVKDFFGEIFFNDFLEN